MGISEHIQVVLLAEWIAMQEDFNIGNWPDIFEGQQEGLSDEKAISKNNDEPGQTGGREHGEAG